MRTDRPHSTARKCSQLLFCTAVGYPAGRAVPVSSHADAKTRRSRLIPGPLGATGRCPYTTALGREFSRRCATIGRGSGCLTEPRLAHREAVPIARPSARAFRSQSSALMLHTGPPAVPGSRRAEEAGNWRSVRRYGHSEASVMAIPALIGLPLGHHFPQEIRLSLPWTLLHPSVILCCVSKPRLADVRLRDAGRPVLAIRCARCRGLFVRPRDHRPEPLEGR